jgi:hypothetical protein
MRTQTDCEPLTSEREGVDTRKGLQAWGRAFKTVSRMLIGHLAPSSPSQTPGFEVTWGSTLELSCEGVAQTLGRENPTTEPPVETS